MPRVGDVLKLGENMQKLEGLLPKLKEIQEEEGYLAEKRLEGLSLETGVPIASIYEVASFYSFLNTEKKGKYIIRVCNSPSCYLNGFENAKALFEEELGIKCGETTPDDKFTLEVTACIGRCDEAPAALVNNEAYTKLTAEKVREVIEQCK
jgi:NADH-quinone oxidoreductase subunit E